MAARTQQRSVRAYPAPTHPLAPRQRRDLSPFRRRAVLSGGGPAPGATDAPMSDNVGGNTAPASFPTSTPEGGGGLVGNGTDPSGGTFSHPSGSQNTSTDTGNAQPTKTGPGSGTGDGNGSDNTGGTAGPTQSVPGSGPGDVFGPHQRTNGLPAGVIAAIALAVLLVLILLGVAGTVLWRRRRERRGSYHTSELPGGALPGQVYSETSLNDPRTAERLRGGVVDPSSSTGMLVAQYQIEPFAIPLPWPSHARTSSTARLLDDADPFAGGRAGGRAQAWPEKQRPLFQQRASSQSTVPRLPRGAMCINPQHNPYAGLTPLGTPVGTPAADDDLVFELPPTYQSLQQPRPVRRWYQIWPPAGPSGGGGGQQGDQSRLL